MRNRKNEASAEKGQEPRRTGGAHASVPAKAAKRQAPEKVKKPKPVRDDAEKAGRKAAKAQEKARREEERLLKKEAAKAARKAVWKKLRIAGIVLLALLALAAGGAAYGGYRVTVSGVNLPNLYMDGVFVGGMDREQTRAALEEHGWTAMANSSLTVTLPLGAGFSVSMNEVGAVPDLEEAAEAAYAYGHSGNWFENLWLYLRNLISALDVGKAELSLDQDYIRQQAQSGIDDFTRLTAEDAGYRVDEENEELVLVKGAGEMRIDLDALCQEVNQAVLSGQTSLSHDHIDNELAMPDFNAIHQELGVETADAHFKEGTVEVVDEVIGCSFDVAQAQSLWQAAQPGQEVRVPLIIDFPSVTGDQLRGLLFRDCLGSQTTSYRGSTSNRINNIHLASEKLNGLILLPGEEFSYNGTVGERTTEAGFLAADAYSNGSVIQEIGGGICQVSSTLYCATMYAQMETVERTNHYFKVGYLAYAMDATVSWGGPDFRFRNCREYPVKIVTVCNDEESTLTIEIWGTDVDGSYVELRSSVGAIYDDEYTDVIVGYGAVCTRIIYDKDGNKIDEIRENYGIYHLHEENIKWPEKKDNEDDADDEYGGDAGGGTDEDTGGAGGDTGDDAGGGDDEYGGDAGGDAGGDTGGDTGGDAGGDDVGVVE